MIKRKPIFDTLYNAISGTAWSMEKLYLEKKLVIKKLNFV